VKPSRKGWDDKKDDDKYDNRKKYDEKDQLQVNKRKAGKGSDDRRGSNSSVGSFTSVGLKGKMQKGSDNRDTSLKKDDKRFGDSDKKVHRPSDTKAGGSRGTSDNRYDPLGKS
jgi:hypothetical protein